MFYHALDTSVYFKLIIMVTLVYFKNIFITEVHFCKEKRFVDFPDIMQLLHNIKI